MSRVYISADMEGITGVTVAKHIDPGEREYERSRRWMTQDINAAVEGALAGGAEEVVVSDAHGPISPISNILLEELHPAARLLSGGNRLLGQMEGIDQGFQMVFFVGYHQREGGGDGFFNHTLVGSLIYELRINGEPADEALINAGLAGAFDIPIALVTGDAAVCQDAQHRFPGVFVAPVKEAFDRWGGVSLTPERAQKLIREQANNAVQAVKQGKISPYRVGSPVTFEVDFKRTAPAHMATLFPGVARRTPRTIAITDTDYVQAFKLLWGCLIVGMVAISDRLL